MTTTYSPQVSGTGPFIPTRARTGDFPPVAKAYREVSQIVRESGLLRRAPGFYAMVGAGIAVSLGAVITGFILLGDSWFQLLIAAALAIVLTQIGFVGHEAAHRVILKTGPANDRLALALLGIIGMSYNWWDSKHSRHHQNPNRIGKDPDIQADTISFIEEDAGQSRGLIRALTKRQGWLFFPLLTLEGLNLHLQGIVHLCQRGPVKGRWIELSLIVSRFAILITPIFVFLPVGKAFAFLGVMFALFGVYLRGLDPEVRLLIEAAQPTLAYEEFDAVRRAALADALVWRTSLGVDRDTIGLGIERNAVRTRSVVTQVRLAEDGPLAALVRVLAAALLVRAPISLSTGQVLPAPVADLLAGQGIEVSLERDDDWMERLAVSGPLGPGELPAARVRLIGGDPVRAAEWMGGLDRAALWADTVTMAGPVELLTLLREQAISARAHRHGLAIPVPGLDEMLEAS